jgi:hypothetical protein
MSVTNFEIGRNVYLISNGLHSFITHDFPSIGEEKYKGYTVTRLGIAFNSKDMITGEEIILEY